MSLSRLSRPFHTAHRQSFASTVLLSRTWENETVVELRKEARARGLSTKGNKATLVARIREHESTVLPPVSTPGTARSSFQQAVSPGIPLTAQPDSATKHPNFLVIKLPDLSQPPPHAPVQIPYLPDFWNSAQPNVDAPAEPELPKLHVVSGSATHYDGGPTYNLEKHRENHSLSTTVQPDELSSTKGVSLWADFWDSLGLPRPSSVRRTSSEAGNLAGHTQEVDSQTRSRPLTTGERKGLYALLGIVGGSWLVGELVNRPTVAEEHDTQIQH